MYFKRYLAKRILAQGYFPMNLSKHRHEHDKKAKLFNIITNIALPTSETLPENKKKKSLTWLNKRHY